MSRQNSSNASDSFSATPEAAFSINAGRNAFRTSSNTAINAMDVDELRRQQFAMRSFTESVELEDMPQAPELPPELDIDRYDFEEHFSTASRSSNHFPSSSTTETIVEVAREPISGIDAVTGETLKYPMTVPEPGHTELEIELHQSLVRASDSGEDSDNETTTLSKPISAATTTVISSAMTRARNESERMELRRKYSNTVTQRPRPASPPSRCSLDQYASESESSAVPEAPKMRVKIPKKVIKRKMEPEEFYATLTNSLPAQIRQRMTCVDPDADIIEQIPEFKSKAPPAPVIHRRSSVEWEAFGDSNDSNIEMPLPSKANTPPVSPVNSASEKSIDEVKNDETVSSVVKKLTQSNEPKTELSTSLPPVVASKPETAEAFAEELFANRNDVEWNTAAENTKEFSLNDASFMLDESEIGPEPATEPETNEDNKLPYNDVLLFQSTPTINIIPDYNNYDVDEDEVKVDAEVPQHDVSEVIAEESSVNVVPNVDSTETQPTVDQCAYNQAYPDSYEHSYYSNDPNAYDYDYTQTQAADGTTEYNAYAAADPNAINYDYGNYDYSNYYGTHTDGTVDYNAYYAAHVAHDETANNANQTYDDSQVDPTTYSMHNNGTFDSSGYDQAAYYDPSAYNYNVDEYGTGYSYGEEVANYDQYGVSTEPQVSVEAGNTESGSETAEKGANESVHVAPQFIQAALPPMRSRTPDPFSWEMQETNIEKHGTALPPPRPPPALLASPEPEVMTENNDAPVSFETAVASAPPRPPAPGPLRPPPPPTKAAPTPPPPMKKTPAVLPPKQDSDDEDAWTKFKKMTDTVSTVVKSTEDKMKELSESSAANDIKDESYLATIGGHQGLMTPAIQRQMQQLEEEKKKAKADKKKAKKLQKSPSPELDPQKELDLDKAAADLAAKLALTRAHDLDGYVPVGITLPTVPRPSHPAVPERHTSPMTPDTPKPTQELVPDSSYAEINEEEQEVTVNSDEKPPNWAAFDESSDFELNLPPSESDFFTTHLKEVPSTTTLDPFAPQKPPNPFESVEADDAYDPFDIQPAEDIVAQAKERATLLAARAADDPEFDYLRRPISAMSSPTPEGGSPISARPGGFEDNFKPSSTDSPTPLFDEDDSEPLTEFPRAFIGDGWEMMIRYPPKKKIMTDRYWKPCYVKVHANMLYVFNSKTEQKALQEIRLQPNYSLSDNTLQAYDIYGKIHTVKLQCVSYKERIGIRAGQISRLVEGHVTKYGLPFEHAAQVNVLAKFGSLNSSDIASFINVIENFLFTATIKREIAPAYKQDEVQIHCYDEYEAHVDKNGFVSQQQARVRMFCLAFLTGSPFLEIGLNDRRRQGKEIVRRKDILPMYTERWIRFENVDFHCTVDKSTFDEEQVLKLAPPDGVFFEICRFRIRPPKNREKPLTIRNFMRIAGSKIEIRIDVMAAAQTQRARGTVESTRNIPCEDICIRFPIPEAWIYIFREEKHFGVGSIHSKTRRVGKVKNFRDRLMGTVTTTEPTLIETAIGEAKYEHVYRALVWRIPRLPEKHHAAYKEHVLKCRFELSSFDLMPEVFLPTADVEFTMPLATVSNTVVRSVSIEQHEDSDRVEKFVRYVAKCKYQIEVDYVQCNNLDNDAIFDLTVANPEAVMSQPAVTHTTLYNPDEVQKQHGGYGIEFSASETGVRQRNDSSSDEEPEKRAVPIVEINMQGYGY